MKRFIFFALINAIVGIMGLVSVNFKVDSANIYNPPSFYSDVAKHLSKGHNIMFNGNWDERLFKKHLLLNNEKTPLFILGSSRAMQVNSQMINTPVLNLGVSGAVLQDYIGFYSIIRSTKKPSKILIIIDPWVFNKNNGESRWKSLNIELNDYFDKINLNNPYSKEGNNYYKVKNLLSISYLQANIKSWFYNNESFEVTLNNHSYSKNIYKSDGSLKYSDKYHNRDSNEIRLETAKYVRKNIYHMSNFNGIDSIIVVDFIKQIMKDKNQLFLFLMPFNPQIFSQLSTKLPNIKKIEELIYRLGSDLNIPVNGSFNPANLGITSDYFLDGMHLKRNGVQKVIKNSKIQYLIHTP